MRLRSARFSGDRVLERCAAGAHRMLAGEDNISVLRVQEALTTLGYPAGTLDGYFGPNTGAAVTAFKLAHGLNPPDAVVGPGTSTTLDAALFFDPPYQDPAFGEVSSFVATHSVEPFVGLELNRLLTSPINTVKHDIGKALLSQLTSGFCLAIVAQSRAVDIPDPRLTADAKNRLAGLHGSALTVPFTGTDGLAHVAVSLRDLTIMGRRVSPGGHGRVAKATLRGALCHELTHVRNLDRNLGATADGDGSIFLDTGLAASLSASTGTRTAVTFEHFVHEMVASHVEWITIREDLGDPFAARFLAAAKLAEAAKYYFADTDPSWFRDNGYIAACVRAGDVLTYRQIALWLRAASGFTFSDDTETNQISSQLFWDAAFAAEHTAEHLGDPRPAADGVYPAPGDYYTPN